MVRLERAPVLSTPGVVSIVSFGADPIPIPDVEIHGVRTMLRSGLAAEPCVFVNVGDRVSVKQGPLAGVSGIVIALKGKLRLVVSVPLLQRSVSAELDRDWVVAG